MKDKPVLFAQALASEVADKRIDILRRIGEVGSISEAARGARVSYKAAWQAVETLTNLAGVPLLEKVVGGSGGGGAQLTKAGQRLLHASDLLNAARAGVLARLAGDSDADTPISAIASLGLRTSMRNHLPCIIKSIRRSPPSIRVELELADEQSIFSRITRESIDLLDLQPAQNVLALFKATAVHVARTIDVQEGSNLLHGIVARVASTSTGAEVAITLPSGLQLVGFAAVKHGLKRGNPAMAALDESAVVIAVNG